MAVQVYYVVEDGKGERSTITIDLPPATSAANARGFAILMASAIAPLTNGGLVSAGVRLDVTINPAIWPAAAQAAADVQEKALFGFRNIAGNFAKKIHIPAFIESLFVPGSKLVDTSDLDVIVFQTAMLTGYDTTSEGGTGVVQPTTSHGEDLDDWTIAREAWGKYRP